MSTGTDAPGASAYPNQVSDAEIVAAVRAAEHAGDIDHLEGGVPPKKLAGRVGLSQDRVYRRTQPLVEAGELVRVWGADPETYKPQRGYRTPESVEEVGGRRPARLGREGVTMAETRPPEESAAYGEQKAGATHEKKPCPRCGVPQGNLPNHLRSCTGGESDD